MSEGTVDVCETFVSIQGESTFAGMPCFFIRLAGCNLRCAYCDTAYAFGPGRPVALDALVAEADASDAPVVEITGGEPLLQPACAALAARLRRPGRTVLVETNGTLDISVLPEGVGAVMDIKCPGSGAEASFLAGNVERLRPYDEVKFVLVDRRDYEFARTRVRTDKLAARCRAVHFSPVFGQLEPATLGAWILDDRLPVRLQPQLHKLLGLR